ncbi:uncharacterized protein LOC128127243 [Lactuca sativa]|uniref:uncharacterized protein LOC128127243 n=1 Tax=Lactuca sativa TaxID=4236 RepID=UPI0022B06E2A|nr:uncharacterized protein LOC128127243 [Lactuca sativa]
MGILAQHIMHPSKDFWMLLFLMKQPLMGIILDVLVLNARTWWAHGERNTISQHEEESSNPMQDPMEDDDDDDDDVNGCTQMLMDVMEERPNPTAKGFYDMLEDADEPLWDGCENYSKLQVATELLHWKPEYNISEAAYDHILPIIKRMLPKGEKLVENFYETKKLLKIVRLPEKKDPCLQKPLHDILWADSDLTKCRVCDHDRYKSGRLPYLVMRYLPIAPRLQRLYLTKKTAKQMTRHYEHQTELGLMVHPSDGEAWKHFDLMHQEFSSEPRNVRLGLCTDGFSPNNSNTTPYSCWPVFLSIYNLPPWMCLKEPYVQLSIVIPGKKSPGQNIDVFLRPLIDELKMIYTDGVVTYDASTKCNFTMKAILLWTVSDFPAYAMLSGWSTHGKLACSYCMGKPFRAKNAKLPGFGITHNWVKRSMFWELPFWRKLLIRHNLDPMHIETNVFENLFNTVMDTPKSKDNMNARKDIEMYCNRVQWHTWKNGNKDMKKRSSFALSKEQVAKICQWLIKLKFPDGYASNLGGGGGGCVNVDDNSFYKFKSHECHVFLQRLLPISLRGMVPNSTWDAITELCTFFRVICSRMLRVDDLQRLQTTIVETICKLEKIFPPRFFDSMEHLVIHLAQEAMLGGPVQYRWMYLYERKLGSMKRKIKNHAKVEGSIVEAYMIGEISTFCSQYFLPTIETRLNRESRNFAPDIPSYTMVNLD